MALLLALLAQALAPPAVSPEPPLVDPGTIALPRREEPRDALNDRNLFLLGRPVPPTEIIDFLGRRRRCAGLGDLPGYRGERSRWRCAALPGEERALRASHAGDRVVLRWLDQNPFEFELPRMRLDRTRRPVDIWPEKIEQSGTNPVTGLPYRILIETRVARGRLTRITASFDGLPARSFTLDNRAFPMLDVQTLTTMLLSPPRDNAHMLLLFMTYGHPRGYCSDDDDRPSVQISFDRTGAYGATSPRDNCIYDQVPVADAAAR
jgi:hypothetical protein